MPTLAMTPVAAAAVAAPAPTFDDVALAARARRWRTR
jgi:hypothetical protein